VRSAADSSATGTQSIDRAVLLLRLISGYGTRGARLTDLAAAAGLAPPTARRILKRLAEHRLVEQDPVTQRYMLGALTYELGVVAARRPPILAALRPALERLAEETGDTVYLIVRSGTEGVCLDRVEGGFPIKTLTLAIGSRQPLGVGPASLTLLAALPDGEVEQAIAANLPLYARYPSVRPERLHADIREVRKRGYALRHDAFTAGVAGIGIAVPNGDGVPYAAVSLAMIDSRMTKTRAEELLALLRAVILGRA